VAERTWDALERARAEARLQETQRRQGFLLALSDRLRRETDAKAILREAVAMLGRELNTGRIGYAEIDAPADLLSVDVEWTEGGLPSITGSYPFSSFGARNIAALGRGETVVFADVASSEFVDAQNRPAMDAMGIQAAITVPLLRNEQLAAVLSVHNAAPRAWTEAEVQLVEEVAVRTWSTVERAAAETSLRKSEEHLRLALEGAEMGTWDYDLASMEGWWSPRTCEIYGVPFMDVVPPDLRYGLVHPDDLERYLREVDEAVYAGRPFSIEYRIIRPDREMRWVVLRGVVQSDATGAPVRSTGITMDVTERKLADERYRQSQADLERSREAFVPVGEDDRAGQPARGRGARAEQPARRGGRARHHARRRGGEHALRLRRRQDSQGGRAVRAHRAELPGHGASETTRAAPDRRQCGRSRRPGARRIRAPNGRG
jgi:PAS domain S-box-containing protein